LPFNALEEVSSSMAKKPVRKAVKAATKTKKPVARPGGAAPTKRKGSAKGSEKYDQAGAPWWKAYLPE